MCFWLENIFKTLAQFFFLYIRFKKDYSDQI